MEKVCLVAITAILLQCLKVQAQGIDTGKKNAQIVAAPWTLSPLFWSAMVIL